MAAYGEILMAAVRQTAIDLFERAIRRRTRSIARCDGFSRSERAIRR